MNFLQGPANALKAQPISLSLTIDGRTLAQAVSDQLEYFYRHPTGAPAADGLAHFFSGDHNHTDT
jgi:hypothetical protein